MPEGDTIHKLAAAIAPRLEGTSLERFEIRGDRSLDLRGRRVERVEAYGKHLVISLEGDLIVRTHLGMTGSWHRYAVGERWKRPARQSSVVLANGSDVFVCFNAKEAECIRARGARAASSLGRLGPDLVRSEMPSIQTILERARRIEDSETPIADVLLSQSVASGIGNVYKSELLFLNRLHPLDRLRDIDDEILGQVYGEAHRLLRKNLGGGLRVTRDVRDGAGELWVYKRARKNCFRCSTNIVADHLGRDRRITYWCPTCQQSSQVKGSTS